MARGNNSNQLLVNGTEYALEQLEIEIVQEFGVQLGALVEVHLAGVFPTAI
ncbi:hypothetical protein [Bacillus sp. OV322]|uniref:hypothetical protein n=1 Tax=Bacillus sp. OV322 TaxID=1882764 RepID=UPI0015A6126D